MSGPIDDMLSYLQRRRTEVAVELERIDAAMAALGALGSNGPAHQVEAELPIDRPPTRPPTHPVPAKRDPEPRQSARPRPLRRMFTASAKRAGADLGRQIGAAAAAEHLDVDQALVEGWMRWFKPDKPADEQTVITAANDAPAETSGSRKEAEVSPPPPSAPPSPAAPLAAVPDLKGAYECSCGWSGDEDGWRRHNDRLQVSEYRNHKLVRRAAS